MQRVVIMNDGIINKSDVDFTKSYIGMESPDKCKYLIVYENRNETYGFLNLSESYGRIWDDKYRSVNEMMNTVGYNRNKWFTFDTLEEIVKWVRE